MTFPITAHPNAPEGTVRTLVSYDKDTFTLPCIVLCRTTAPLVGLAYAMLKRNIPATVKGKDIGAGLIAIVRKQNAVEFDDLIDKLVRWHHDELSRAEDAGKNPERIEDQYSCLTTIIERVGAVRTATVETVIAALESLFSDDNDDHKVLLSTIHRAKGLEYPTVFILDRSSTLPSKYAKTKEAKEQERNLWFVAATRSQGSLFYITSNCWKTQ